LARRESRFASRTSAQTVAVTAETRLVARKDMSHGVTSFSRTRSVNDPIVEAKGEAYGTNIWTRTYRGDSNYGGVRRTGWS
jgi:hypothetical protein